MNAKPAAAVAYIRVSTDEQATEGVSLAAQEAALRAYATFRGLELRIVVDAGVSAGKPLAARPGGAAVLRMVARREVSVVAAFKLDRLFRDCADCLATVREWDTAGVALHLLDLGGQALDTSSAMGRFFLTVMAGAAELERNQIRERTRTALAHKRDNGDHLGGVPFGFALAEDGCHLVEDDDEQAIVALVRSYRAEGLSIRTIAARLNEEKPAAARGARWHPTTVARMLRGAA